MKKIMLPPLFFSVRIPTLLAIFWRSYIYRGRTNAVQQKAPLSFIIFRLDSLGDVVMTTPMFRALKQAHPKSRCTVVVQGCYKSLLVTNPNVDEILTLPKLELEWLPRRVKRLVAALLLYRRQLRNRHFDFAVSPRWDVDEHLATFLCVLTSAGKRVGYSCSSSQAKRRINRGFDAAFDICLPAGQVRHEVRRNLAVAEVLGAATDDDELEVFITDRDRRKAGKLLANISAGAQAVALGIGAQTFGRRWPLSLYAKTVNRLIGVRNIQPVIICAAAELGDALELDTLLRRSAIIISGARLREVCAVLERCSLFIGNDSGCAHLAAAMDCRSVVISRHPRNGDPNHFNSPVRFAPHGSTVKVLQPLVGRAGCRDACVESGPHCICDVSVENVVSTALELLSLARPVSPPAMQPWMPVAPSPPKQVHAPSALSDAVDALHARSPRPVM